jgi:hypothetical protein
MPDTMTAKRVHGRFALPIECTNCGDKMTYQSDFDIDWLPRALCPRCGCQTLQADPIVSVGPRDD